MRSPALLPGPGRDGLRELGAEQLAGLIQALAVELGGEITVGALSRPKGKTFAAPDPVLDHLLAQIESEEWNNQGHLIFDCPWADEHTVGGGTDAAWLPAGTNGHPEGRFNCFHNSCRGRSLAEFHAAIGYHDMSVANDFEALPPLIIEPGADAAPVVRVFDPKSALALAEGTLRGAFRLDGRLTLVRHSGLWYEYNGAAYEELPGEELRGRVWRFLGSAKKEVTSAETVEDGGKPKKVKRTTLVPLDPTQANINAAIDAMQSFIGAGRTPVPGWLPGYGGPDAREIAPLTDGLLHVPTRTLLPHTPGLFTLNALPFAWGDGNGAPHRWLQFLDEVFPGDGEAKQTLQEIMGYLLTPDTSQQKMFMVIGPRRCGKGTIGRVIGALLGATNIAAPTLTQLTGDFGLEPLIGKLVALFPDARAGSGPAFNNAAVVERLLMASGEDAITINRKGKAMWTGALFSRVLILSNQAPKLGDASGALPGRFITLKIEPTFYGREDIGLMAKLKAELPSIFRWALDGRDRLMAREHFIQPESGREVSDELYELGSPMVGFVNECCDLDAGATTPVAELYQAWQWWAGQNGHHPGAANTFSRNLHAAYPQLGRSRPRAPDGAQMKSTDGMRLKLHVKQQISPF